MSSIPCTGSGHGTDGGEKAYPEFDSTTVVSLTNQCITAVPLASNYSNWQCTSRCPQMYAARLIYPTLNGPSCCLPVALTENEKKPNGPNARHRISTLLKSLVLSRSPPTPQIARWRECLLRWHRTFGTFSSGSLSSQASSSHNMAAAAAAGATPRKSGKPTTLTLKATCTPSTIPVRLQQSGFGNRGSDRVNPTFNRCCLPHTGKAADLPRAAHTHTHTHNKASEDHPPSLY